MFLENCEQGDQDGCKDRQMAVGNTAAKPPVGADAARENVQTKS